MNCFKWFISISNMNKATIYTILIQLYLITAFAKESDESESFIKTPCPGLICGEQCCVVAGYICCDNNLFCAKDAQLCSDGSNFSVILTINQLCALQIIIRQFAHLGFN